MQGVQTESRSSTSLTPPHPPPGSQADHILTILALNRSGGRYPLRFRTHIRKVFISSSTAPHRGGEEKEEEGGCIFLNKIFLKYPAAAAGSEQEESASSPAALLLLGFFPERERRRVVERPWNEHIQERENHRPDLHCACAHIYVSPSRGPEFLCSETTHSFLWNNKRFCLKWTKFNSPTFSFNWSSFAHLKNTLVQNKHVIPSCSQQSSGVQKRFYKK